MKTKTLFLIFILISFQWMPAMACKGGETNPSWSFLKEFKSSTIVFFGKIVSTKLDGHGDTVVEFEVLKNWKGDKSSKIQFTIQTGRSCDLGKYAEINSTWLIMAKSEHDKILTQSHSRRFFEESQKSAVEAELKSLTVSESKKTK